MIVLLIVTKHVTKAGDVAGMNCLVHETDPYTANMMKAGAQEHNRGKPGVVRSEMTTVEIIELANTN
jgi:hypothetical protein